MALHADGAGCGCAILYRWRWTRKATSAWWDHHAHRLPLLMDIDKFFVVGRWYLCPDCED